MLVAELDRVEAEHRRRVGLCSRSAKHARWRAILAQQEDRHPVLVRDGERDGIVSVVHGGLDGVSGALRLDQPESVLLKQTQATLRRPRAIGQCSLSPGSAVARHPAALRCGVGWSAHRKTGLTMHSPARSFKGFTLLTPLGGDA